MRTLIWTWEGPLRKDQVPKTFVLRGTWPEAELSGDAPVGAYYGQHLARLLKQVRDQYGLTQRDLAERSGVAHNTIGRIMRGTVYPDLATLARLEQALGGVDDELAAGIYPAGLYRTIRNEPTT